MRVTIRFLGPVFFVLLLSTPALAQPAAPEPEPAPATNARSGQKYDGVAPGAGTKNPLPQAPDGGPYLVWTGFQMTAGGSRVFLQTTRSVMFDVKHGGSGKASKSMLEVLLHGCRIHMANNQRKIDTRYFATPVFFVSARQKGKDVEVRIGLRERVSVTPREEAGPDGTQFLVVDFPPGTAEPEPPSLAEPTSNTEISDSEQMQAGDSEQSLPRKAAKKSSKSAP